MNKSKLAYRSRSTADSDDEYEQHDADEDDAATHDEDDDEPVREGAILLDALDPLDSAADAAVSPALHQREGGEDAALGEDTDMTSAAGRGPRKADKRTEIA